MTRRLHYADDYFEVTSWPDETNPTVQLSTDCGCSGAVQMPASRARAVGASLVAAARTLAPAGTIRDGLTSIRLPAIDVRVEIFPPDNNRLRICISGEEFEFTQAEAQDLTTILFEALVALRST